jgi:hypothetical protein
MTCWLLASDLAAGFWLLAAVCCTVWQSTLVYGGGVVVIRIRQSIVRCVEALSKKWWAGKRGRRKEE